MPLVFTQNEVSLSEIDYADDLGKSYEYPSRYRKLIQVGERFVYYRGRRRADGSSQTPSYLGIGTVGEIREVGDRLRCTVEHYQPFKNPVPFKLGGVYREPEANERSAVGFYFQVGVRPIDEASYDAIVVAGLGQPTAKRAVTAATHKTPRPTKKAVPSIKPIAQDDAQALALALATAEAKSQWPSAKIFRAPAGQYFSLIVRHPSGETHHVAVKSSTEAEPRVRLSKGEIAYANTHASTYSLWVFYDVNLDAGTGKLIRRKGRITDEDVDLEAAIHGGRLKNVKSGKNVGPIGNLG